MSVLAPEHTIQWVTASPLWDETVTSALGAATPDEEERLRRPAILRFASDAFMDDLAALLAARPPRLDGHVAKPVSFRARPPGAPADWPPKPDRLKLYQPAHGDFYLVAATLVCRLPGLPEHLVRPAEESVGFLLRRLHAGSELAWVDDPAVGGKGWREVASGDEGAVAEGEEILPLFPVNFVSDDRSRQLFVGLVPTSSGETFANTGVVSVTPAAGVGPAAEDPRFEGLEQTVIQPLRSLQEPVRRPDDVSDSEFARILAAAAEHKVDASRFLLLDLADYLRAHLEPVWLAVLDGTRPSGAARTLFDNLAAGDADSDENLTWTEALKAAWERRDDILGVTGSPTTLTVNLEKSTPSAAVLNQWLVAAGPSVTRAAAAGPPSEAVARAPESARVRKLDPRGDALYRIRCVYQRPLCGPLHDDVVSDPTEDFRMAGFFDPDAPARPVEIALPVDTNVRDLRAFNRNVSVAISDQLREQMSRVSKMSELAKGNMGSGETFEIGFICSFSIPIITICALILLMIMVNLLNLVFRWLPFFQICYPASITAKRA